MKKVPWLLLAFCLLQGSLHAEPVRRRRMMKNNDEKSSERKELLKALSAMISEAKQSKENVDGRPENPKKGDLFHITINDYDEFRHRQLHQTLRQGRQEEEGFDVDDYEDFQDELDGSGDDDKNREGRQGSDSLEECETTGFETMVREECEEASEIECNPVTVTRYKSEIVKRCKTLVDKTCNVTYTNVPKEECEPTEEQKCHTTFKLESEKLYKEECHTQVQHICEEHITVPIEVPYPPPEHPYPPPWGYSTPPALFPHPPPPPALYPHPPAPPPPPPPPPTPSPPPPPPPPYQALPTPPPNRRTPVAPLAHMRPEGPMYQTTFSPHQGLPTQPRHPRSNPSYAYDPTPTPYAVAAPLTEFLNRLGRQKRDVFGVPNGPPGFPVESHPAEQDVKLKRAISDFFKLRSSNSSHHHKSHNLQHVGHLHHHTINLSGHGKHPKTESKEFKHMPHPPHHSHHHHDHHSHGQNLHHHGHHEDEIVRGALEDLLFKLNHPEQNKFKNNAHPFSHHHHHPPDHIKTFLAHLQDTESKIEAENDDVGALTDDELHPPIITTEEIPAPHGCRAIATKTCQKVPHIVTNKVPYETCELVPSVKCHLGLKKVAELECVPVVEEECNDFAKEIPYLVGEEQCEEVFFDDCFEIEEMVPVLVCTRTRLDDKTLFIQRGAVMRKEGEKRRKKTGRRPTGEEKKKKELRQKRSVEFSSVGRVVSP